MDSFEQYGPRARARWRRRKNGRQRVQIWRLQRGGLYCGRRSGSVRLWKAAHYVCTHQRQATGASHAEGNPSATRISAIRALVVAENSESACYAQKTLSESIACLVKSEDLRRLQDLKISKSIKKGSRNMLGRAAENGWRHVFERLNLILGQFDSIDMVIQEHQSHDSL